MKRISFLSIFLVLFLLSSCMQPIILLSPEDHYVLGNYFIEEGKAFKAKEQFELIRDKYPTSEFATMSQFKLAQTQFTRKKYSEAAIDFSLFLEFHPAHKLSPFAQYHLALCKYKSMLEPDRDATIAQEALVEFNKLLILYPDHSYSEEAKNYISKIEEHLAWHEFEAGMVYYRRKQYSAALNRFRPILSNVKSRTLFQKSHFYSGKCYERFNKIDDARKMYQQIVNSKFEKSKWTRKAKSRLNKLPLKVVEK